MTDAPAEVTDEYTVEQFESLAWAKDYELVAGRPIPKHGGNLASLFTGNLACLLGPFVRAHRLGFVQGARAGYVLRAGVAWNLRKPSLSFVVRGRYPDDRPPDGYARLAPDFAFEMVFPDDRADDVQDKVEEYLRAGVRLVWVAYPKPKVILAFRPDGSVRRFAGADVLSADDLFPGFACPAAEVFAVV